MELLKKVLWIGVKTAPPFILKDLEGDVKGLNDFKGHVILLHFWATWCVPCKDELPTIKALWEMLKDKGFLVVAIATDLLHSEQPQALKPAVT